MAEERKIILQVGVDAKQIKELIAELDKTGKVGKESAEKIAAGFKSAGQKAKASFSGDQLANKFKETEKSSQGLKQELRALQKELTSLELNGQRNTKRFQELQIRSGQLVDVIGDVSARVKVLSSDTRKLDAAASVVTGLAGAYAAVQGATALFGKENKKLQEQLLKVQAAMAILNGLQAVFATLNNTSAAAVTANAISTRLATAVMRLFGGAVLTTSFAFKALKTAIITTGIGALAVGVGLLIENFDKLKSLVIGTKDELSKDDLSRIFGDAEKNLIKQNEEFERQIKNQQRLAEFEKERASQFAELELARLNLIGASELKIAEFKEKSAVKQTAIEAALANKILAIRNKQANISTEIERRANLLQLSPEQRDKVAAYIQEITDLRIAASDEVQLIENKTTQIISLAALERQKIERDALKKSFDAFVLKNGEISKKLIERFKIDQEKQKQLRIADAQTQASIAILGLQLLFDATGRLFEENAQIEIKIAKETAKQKILQLEAEQNARIKAGESAVLVAAETALKIRAIEKDTADFVTATNTKTTQQIRAEQQELFSAGVATASEAVNFGVQIGNNQLAQIEKQKQFELQLAGDNAKERERIEEKFAQKSGEIRRKQAIAEKIAAAFSVAVNGPAAITKALVTSNLLAAFVAGAVALQIAAIAAAPIPEFGDGGTVKGRSHLQGGVLIEAEGGEEIINKKSSSKHREVIKAINSDRFESYILKSIVQPIIERRSESKSNYNFTARMDSKKMENELYMTRSAIESQNKTLKKIANQSNNKRAQW